MFLITGNDEYLIDTHVQNLIKEKFSNHEVKKYSYDFNISQFINDIMQGDLFAEHKVFWIKNWDLFSATTIKKSVLQQILSSLKYSQFELIFSFQGEFFKNEITDFVSDNSQKYNYEKMDSFKINDYIKNYVKENNIKISQANINYLLTVLPDDLSTITTELNKLSYLGKVIDQKDIEESISFYIKDNGFNFINSLASGNATTILKNYNDEIESGVEPIQLMGQIANSFILALEINNFYKEYHDMDKVADAMKLNKYRTRKLNELNIVFGVERIKELVILLSELDYRLKRTNISHKNALDYFILRVIN